MKSKTPLSSFTFPAPPGITEGELARRYSYAAIPGPDATEEEKKKLLAIKREHLSRLNHFREEMTPLRFVTTMALFAFTDPHNAEQIQEARFSDIARAMYNPAKGGKFSGSVIEQIEESVIRLYRMDVPFFYRVKAGTRTVHYINKKGKNVFYQKPVYNLRFMITRPIQSFGPIYEDEEGKRVDISEDMNLQAHKGFEKSSLIKYESIGKDEEGKDKPEPTFYALAATDRNGNIIKNKDGTPRRERLDGIFFRWGTDFLKWRMPGPNRWIIYKDLLPVLTEFIPNPSLFKLAIKTIFYETTKIKYGRDKLINELGIKSKDNKRIDKDLEDYFKKLKAKGIIDSDVEITEDGQNITPSKTGRPRRNAIVYRWEKGNKYRHTQQLPFARDGQEANSLTDKDLHDELES